MNIKIKIKQKNIGTCFLRYNIDIYSNISYNIMEKKTKYKKKIHYRVACCKLIFYVKILT